MREIVVFLTIVSQISSCILVTPEVKNEVPYISLQDIDENKNVRDISLCNDKFGTLYIN